jgi:hypothetical protein
MVVAKKVNLCRVSIHIRKVQIGSLPKESREHNGSHTTSVKGTMVAICTPVIFVPTYCDSDERCKPKDHGKKLDTSNRELVGRTREASWCEDEVRYCKQSPYGCEEHELYRVRRPVPAIWAGVLIDHCDDISTTNYINAENNIRYAVKPSTMMEKRTCTPRRPRTITGGTMIAFEATGCRELLGADGGVRDKCGSTFATENLWDEEGRCEEKSSMFNLLFIIDVTSRTQAVNDEWYVMARQGSPPETSWRWLRDTVDWLC